MFRSLYMRLLVVFMAVLVVAMTLLSVLLYQRIRADKIETRLNELVTQANDVAFLAAQLIYDSTDMTENYLMWKATEIMENFDAYLLIVDGAGKVHPIGSEAIEITYDFSYEEMIANLLTIMAGYPVIVPPDMENPAFTIGVPYKNDRGQVLGGVFIHTSVQSIEASYKGILHEGLRAMMITFAIGAVLILVVSQLISRPLRAMARAADRFAKGDFTQRIRVDSQDEVGRLAEALNAMAVDLDRLEQTRRAFVANVSHELRSPLTSMQGFIQGILDGTVPQAEQEHYLNIVLDETRRLNRLISTLLDLSHMDTGAMTLSPQRFDINEMLAQVLLRQETRIESKRMDVQVEFEGEHAFVMADPDRIEQVVVNLIDNAVKYGREEGTITVSTVRQGGLVHICVADDGRGIAEEDLPHVFERFYKVDKAHSSGDGTGLGLSIAKSIIDQHGQSIEVTSAPGEGTAFSFTLEAAKKESAPKALPE